ncbi:exported hypothetical protein [Vibrio chagasii]|uniref:hypothetical protein n=1 Tax=Vibrio sp. T3Y01 TaxID=2607606 RepID=UPI001493A6BC|nr:hypothetical protein [Vibrio sp. T3Y01]CAH6810632.1 exported hypothetical protein [Vibrio chagasii]CAK2518254.1 Lipoprotein [Vibrio crassostreae]NOI98130.1 hypothetical protein [Vibrio sp. T3Y01]CAH6817447.1 exported hypothetical protein [Vibrio chagasii]CAH6829611.1 exported hypothetical protein [Vibrio chagasii]
MFKGKVKFVCALMLLAMSGPTMACSIVYNTSSPIIKQTMKSGFEWHSGWVLDNYQAICERLKRNNAMINISGIQWHRNGDAITQFYIGVSDEKTGLVESSFGKQRIIYNTNLTSQKKLDVDIFDDIQKMIDEWFVSGDFDNSVKSFHKSKIAMRNQ